MTSTILPEDHFTEYNGVKVKWFIGDINAHRAEKLGLKPHWIGKPGDVRMVDNGSIWEAWGSCLGKAYQLFAWYNPLTRELTDITVNKDNESSYFDQNNYDLLTNQ